jgi:sec-independent protein translocase protein TatB
MFDLGFSELIVVFVIALVVLGPTRLPGLVSKVGKWIGKARSMARQFREQLENEVNLDELNRMTDKRAKEAQASTPPIPPEFSGEPLPTDAPGSETSMAGSGYPYGAPEQASAAASTDGSPQPGDDTYSHAHAHGSDPMPYTPEAAEFEPAAPEVILEPAAPEPAAVADATTEPKTTAV